MNNYDIPDVLLADLEEAFGSHHVYMCKTWEETCKLKGALGVLDWLKRKQTEIREGQFSGKETITIDTS